MRSADKDFEITMINMYKKAEGKVYKVDEKNWEFLQRIRIYRNEKLFLELENKYLKLKTQWMG